MDRAYEPLRKDQISALEEMFLETEETERWLSTYLGTSFDEGLREIKRVVNANKFGEPTEAFGKNLDQLVAQLLSLVIEDKDKKSKGLSYLLTIHLLLRTSDEQELNRAYWLSMLDPTQWEAERSSRQSDDTTGTTGTNAPKSSHES